MASEALTTTKRLSTSGVRVDLASPGLADRSGRRRATFRGVLTATRPGIWVSLIVLEALAAETFSSFVLAVVEAAVRVA